LNEARYSIVGTAGHVDHGKTALIRALTGVDTDRLREEKRRGITIDLGFAPFALPGGTLAGMVDVPGHERFIHNMLAGAAGLDLVLLVIDVNEGIRAQTLEHLQILRLLEIPRGLVVLTKCDLAESDWIDLVEEEVREALRGSFLEQAQILRVSARTQEGIEGLKRALAEQLLRSPGKDPSGPARLPVDRHFSLSGFGTVVTGTLLSGSIRLGDALELLPGGQPQRVRDIQIHGRKEERALAGQRVALNLASLDRGLIERGAVVATPGFFCATQRLDVRLQLLAEAPRPLRFRDPVHFFLGTGRAVGRVALLESDELKPGASALAQIHLDRPILAHRTDRFILRSYSPMTTIGGGLVIDSAPPKHRRFRPEVIQSLKELESGEQGFVLQKLQSLGCVKQKDLEKLTGLSPERLGAILSRLSALGKATLMGPQWVEASALRSIRARVLDLTKQYQTDHRLLPGIPLATLKSALPQSLGQKAFDAVLDGLCDENRAQRRAEVLCTSGWAPSPDEGDRGPIEAIEQAYLAGGTLAKNRNEEMARLGFEALPVENYFAYLCASGRLVRLNEESYLHRSAYEQATDRLVEHFRHNETLSLARFRDLIGSARKQTQALLEHYDELKYTRRSGDERLAWKLPEPETEEPHGD